MGNACTISAPAAVDNVSAQSAHHKQAPPKPKPRVVTLSPLGDGHGAAPSGAATHLMLREKIFSWSGDNFKIKTRDGRAFGNNLYIQGKVWGVRDQMVIMDGNTQQPVAVCLRKFEFIGQTFKIYTLRPNYSGQRPSERRYKNQALYTYARLERVPLSTIQNVFLEGQMRPSYTIQ